MDATQLLIAFGLVLLAVAALLGFVQERHRDRPEQFAGWRVVHAGGTAGAVQLLALAAIWPRISDQGMASGLLAAAMISVTYAFFFGPLATVLGQPRLARAVNIVGAVVAVPAYLALPLALL